MKFKKIIYFILCATLVISFSACTKIEEPSTNIPNISVMMEATSSFVGTDSNGKDCAIVSEWVLYYDGLLEYKSESSHGSTTKSITLSKQDLDTIENILKNQNNISDNTTIIDGISWSLKYYDQNEKLLSQYDGYLHANNDYETLYKILTEYFD